MVSIKNIPSGGSDKVTVFILISVAVHALTLILLGTSPVMLSWLLGPEPQAFKKESPITIELQRADKEDEEDRTIEVVHVPLDPAKNTAPPDELVRYAESSRKATVEEFPEESLPPTRSSLFPSPAKKGIIIIKSQPVDTTSPSERLKTEEENSAKKTPPVKEDTQNSPSKETSTAKSISETEPLKRSESLEDIALLNGDFSYPSPSEEMVAVTTDSIGEEAVRPTAPPEKLHVAADAENTVPKPPSQKKSHTARIVLMPSPQRLAQITKETEVYEGHVPKDAKRGTTLLLNTTEFKYQEYFMHIKRKIQFYWEYPSVAARQGQQGRLKISFTITRDGKVKAKDIEFIKGSNYSMLDDAAVTAIRLASPFNPFPKGFEADDITIKGSFEYSLYGYPRAVE